MQDKSDGQEGTSLGGAGDGLALGNRCWSLRLSVFSSTLLALVLGRWMNGGFVYDGTAMISN